MADVEISNADQQTTQVNIAVPGIQGPAGEGVPGGGTANQVLFKQSNTNYDTAWSNVTSAMIGDLEIVNADVAANAEIAVSKLADGAARQLLQTDAAGTGVEWTSNVDIPGTLDVTGAATFDSSVAVTGTLTKSGNNVVTVGDSGTVTSAMILDGTIVDGDVNANAAIAGTKISPNFGSQNVTTTGTATAAALIPSGSSVPTNGVYLPSANNLALATNGQGRLFVDASGNVTGPTSLGINGASPQSPLDVIANTSGYGASFRGRSSDNLFELRFASNNHASIYSSLVSGPTYLAASVNGSERLRIDSSGRLGLGTSTFADSNALLHVSKDNAGGTGGSVVIRNGAANTAGNAAELVFKTSSGFTAGYNSAKIAALQTTSAETADLAFYTYGSGTGTERVRITAGGRVGIGTQTPRSALDVTGNIFVLGGNQIQITNDPGAKGLQLIGNDATNSVIGTMGSQDLAFRTASTERLRITSDGKVGLGTSSPSYTFDVLGEFSTARFKRSGGANDMNLQLESGAGQIYKLTVNDSGEFNLQKTSTSRLFIDASGRVGIGTTSPSGTLHVAAAANHSIILERSGAVAPGNITLGVASFGDSTLTATRGLTLQAGTTGSLVFNTFGANERARIDSSGRLLVGTSTARDVGIGLGGFLQVEGIQSTLGKLSVTQNSNNAFAPARISLGKSKGTTAGNNTLVAENDRLGEIEFAGADGTDLQSVAASIRADVDGTPGADDMPGRLVFATTADGLSSPTERMRIDSSGRVGIGTQTPSGNLHVSSLGNCTVNIESGATAVPTLEFSQGVTRRSFIRYQNAGSFDIINEYGPLAFYTGTGGSESEKARIDSSGRLLVGTSSWYTVPESNFGGTWSQGQQIRVTDTNNAYGGLAVISSSNTVNNRTADIALCRQNSSADYAALSNNSTIGALTFNGADGTKFVRAALIRAEVDGTPGADDMPGRLVFATTADGAASPTERMRLDSSGRLGLGTSSAQELLDIDGDGNSYLRWERDGSAGGYASLTSGGVLRIGPYFSGTDRELALFSDNSNNSWITTGTADKLFLGTNKTIAVTIDGFQQVGIGTTSPDRALSVQGLISTKAPNGATRGLIGPPSWDTSKIAIQTGSLAESSTNAALTQGFSGDTTLNSAPGAPISLQIGGSERARIDSSGRFLVGTSSARTNFSIGGTGYAPQTQLEGGVLQASFVRAASPFVAIAASNTAAAEINTGNISFFGNDGTNYIVTAQISSAVDGTPGANDMPGRLMFSTTADGQQSPTERMRITSDAYVRLASGTGGIQFNGDTLAANALDDYEEGTWTPVIVGQTTAGTGTYSTQLGRYTKVGRQVYCAGTLIWTAHDGTGNMRIEGLPFSSLNVSDLFNAAVFAYVSNITMPANSILMGDMANNTSRITLRSVVTGGGTPSALAMDSAGNIYFSITYQTN